MAPEFTVQLIFKINLKCLDLGYLKTLEFITKEGTGMKAIKVMKIGADKTIINQMSKLKKELAQHTKVKKINIEVLQDNLNLIENHNLIENRNLIDNRNLIIDNRTQIYKIP